MPPQTGCPAARQHPSKVSADWSESLLYIIRREDTGKVPALLVRKLMVTDKQLGNKDDTKTHARICKHLLSIIHQKSVDKCEEDLFLSQQHCHSGTSLSTVGPKIEIPMM